MNEQLVNNQRTINTSEIFFSKLNQLIANHIYRQLNKLYFIIDDQCLTLLNLWLVALRVPGVTGKSLGVQIRISLACRVNCWIFHDCFFSAFQLKQFIDLKQPYIDTWVYMDFVRSTVYYIQEQKGPIAHMGNQFKSINTFTQSYDYITTLIMKGKSHYLFFEN